MVKLMMTYEILKWEEQTMKYKDLKTRKDFVVTMLKC